MAHQEFDPYALLDALRAGDDVDLIRTSVEFVLQQLIEAQASAVIGAAPHERSDERQNYRNGHRPRLLSTKAGDIELQILKAAVGLVLPRDPRATPADRPRAVRSGDGGLRPRRLDAKGRRPGAGARSGFGNLQVRGQPDLRRARQRAGGLSHPSPRAHELPLPVLRRHLREGTRTRSRGLPGSRRRHRRHRERGPGGPRL